MKTIFSSISFAALLLIAFSSCKNESTDKSEEFAINEIVQPEFTEIESVTETKGYTIGDEATDFKLKDVNGKMVSLSDYPDAKGFIVIFTCNTCPFAVASEERIVALNQEFAPKGYPVIAINPNNPAVQPDDTYELMQQSQKCGLYLSIFI